MLVLATLFLISFLVATAVIWIYRLFRRRASNFTLGVRPDTGKMTKLSAQQGYVRRVPGSQKRVQEPAQLVKLGASGSGLKAPWGW